MSVEEVLQVYQGLIRDPKQLQNGHRILDDLLNKQPDFGLISCKIITSSDFDLEFRKLTGYLIRNLLRDLWMTSPALMSQRQDIKGILLNGLIYNMNDFKIVEVLSLIVADLVQQEGIEPWQAYLKEFIMWMNSEETARIPAGLELFCRLFSTNEKSPKAPTSELVPPSKKEGLYVLVPELLPVLFQIFTILESERQREKLLMLVYLAIDSFVWAENTQDELIHQCFDSTYQAWMSLFISVLQTAKPLLRLKKYILKILTKIFSELPKYSMRTLGTMIQPVWKFLNTSLPLFIWHVVYGVPVDEIEEGMKTVPNSTKKKQNPAPKKSAEEDEGFELDEDAELSDDVEAMAVQLIELMRTMVVNMQIRPLVKLGLFPLINCISHYMLLSRRTEQTWNQDGTEFIYEDRDESHMNDLRRQVLSCLSELIQEFSEDATQAIMVVSEKFLMNMREEEVYGFLKDVFEKLKISESKSPLLPDFDSEKLLALVKTSHFEGEHPSHQWKKREVGLILMGAFANDIVTFLAKKMKNYLTTLVDKLVGDFDEISNPILRGRTLWCITEFSEVLASEGAETLLSLYKLAATCLVNEEYLPVKLAAVKAMRTFIFKVHASPKYQEELADEDVKLKNRVNDPEVMESVLDVLQGGDDMTTFIALETIFLLTKINPEFTDSITEKLAPKVARMFQKLIQSNQVENLLKEIIRTFSKSQKAYNQLANAFLPYIYDVLKFKIDTGLSLSSNVTHGKMNEQEFLLNLFELLRVFVKSEASVAQSTRLMEILPVLLKVMIVSTDSSILTTASVCLKAYVTHFSSFILKMNYLPGIMNVITKILSVDSDENAALYIGSLIVLVFANLLNNSVDTNILKQVVTKLAKSKVPSTIQSLVLVYSRLINTNEKETVDFLSSFNVDNKLALKVLVDKWCLYQPLFRGKYTKVSTFLGLTKLFLEKDSRVETLLVIGYNPSHSNKQEVYAPFKIMSLLIRGLDAEIRTIEAKNAKPERGPTVPPGNRGYNYDDDGGRLDTVGDEDSDGYPEMRDDEDDEDNERLEF